MSLTPNSPGQARAYAALIEQERGDVSWWKQPAHYEPPTDPELQKLARELNRRFMAEHWPGKRVHESRYRYRRETKQWRKKAA